MQIIASNIFSGADDSGVIGSKIINLRGFLRVLERAIEAHDFTADRIPGQAFIEIPEAIPFVSCGVGRRINDPSAYVLRSYRGRVGSFLKREFAAATESCAAVVYTLDAYLRDPDITPEETERVTRPCSTLSGEHQIPTHVLVTVLASAGPRSQLSPHRFVANLAGGNREAQVWTADEIRAKAREIMAYENDWVTVADPV